MADDIITKPFSLTTTDYRGLHIYSLTRSMLGFPFVLIWVNNIFLIPYLMSEDQIDAGDWSSFGLWVAAFAAFWLIIIPILSLLVAQKQLKGISHITKTRIVRFTESDISLKGDDFEHVMNWQSLRKAVQTRKAIYLLTKNLSGFVIPKSALEVQSDVNAILALAKRQIAKAKSKKISAFETDIGNAESLSGLQSPPFRLTFGRFFILYISQIYALFLTPLNFLIFIFIALAFVFWNNRFEILAGQLMPYEWLASLQPFIWVIPIFLIALPFLAPLSWLLIRRQPASRGERRVSITPSDIQMAGTSYFMRMNWIDILKIRPRLGMMLFFAKPRGIILVPFSAFPDIASAQAFYDQARVYFNAAKAAAKSTPHAKTLDAKT
jgi:hypothetical protein